MLSDKLRRLIAQMEHLADQGEMTPEVWQKALRNLGDLAGQIEALEGQQLYSPTVLALAEKLDRHGVGVGEHSRFIRRSKYAHH